ncbi:MAG: hypothetical protein IJL52_01395 [Clostridia bacterium]|nr:hypothetical protein [Clostridia bacterium]
MQTMIQKMRCCLGRAARAVLALQPQAPTRALLIGTWCAADGTAVCRFCADGTVVWHERYGRYAFEEDRLVLLWPGDEPTVLRRNAGDPARSYAVTRRRLVICGEALTWSKEKEPFCN